MIASVLRIVYSLKVHLELILPRICIQIPLAAQNTRHFFLHDNGSSRFNPSRLPRATIFVIHLSIVGAQRSLCVLLRGIAGEDGLTLFQRQREHVGPYDE